jgi:hypothetical protein
VLDYKDLVKCFEVFYIMCKRWFSFKVASGALCPKYLFMRKYVGNAIVYVDSTTTLLRF